MMYKIWNKQTCYEIYFRPLSNSSQVEVITYLNGDPFCNPMSRKHLDIKDPEDNTEVWSIEDARENWNAWVTHGGYEVSEVEDYLLPGSMNLQKREKKSNVTMDGKTSNVSEVAKKLKGIFNE